MSINAWGHGAEPEQRSNLSAAAALSYRNQVPVNSSQNQVAVIPGALMGGESYPVRQGFSLDEAQLSGLWVSSNYKVYVQLGSHAHAQDTSLVLEKLALGFDKLADKLRVKIGTLGTKVTPSASWHSAQDAFSEAPLLAQVFFGGHFVDTGLNVEYRLGPMRWGLELWNGDNWPATPGGQTQGRSGLGQSLGAGSYGAYMQAPNIAGKIRGLQWQLDTSVWAMQSQADQRYDQRYAQVGSQGHSHGGNVQSAHSEYNFTGQVGSQGVWGRLKFNSAKYWSQFELEWAQQAAEGSLQTTSAQSQYDNSYEAMRGRWSVGGQRNALVLEYERLGLQNRFLSPSSEAFIESSLLLNQGFEPNMTRLAWLFNLDADITLRTEFIDDNSYSDNGLQRVSLGLIWGRSLFN